MEELDLKELFNIFWMKKSIIIIITLIFTILGVIYTTFGLTPKYRSSTTLVLTQQATNTPNKEETTLGTITTNDINLNSKLVSTYSEIIKSKSVIMKVLDNLNMDEALFDSIKKNVTVTSVNNTEIIKITVSNIDPIKAAEIANEIVPVFTDKVKETFNINNVSIIDKAEVNFNPYNINHIKDIIIFMIIGIVVSIGYVLVSYMFDTSIKDIEDVEKTVDVPVLATISLYEEETLKGGQQ